MIAVQRSGTSTGVSSESVGEVTMPFLRLASHSVPSYHILPVLLAEGTDRSRVMVELRSRGIQSSIHYPPFQQFSAYQDENLGPTPVAAMISARELTLPMYPSMTTDEVGFVVSALRESLACGKRDPVGGAALQP